MKISFATGSLATWLTRAVSALRNRNRVQVTDTALPMQNMPQITPGWDYRPKKAIRRYAALDGAAAAEEEAVDIVNSNPSEANTTDDVWFSFINVDAATKDATTNRPILGDGRALSMYD